ncbi:FKBP-type peptidyl-prolyl cis-trans isomerase [uncultured archaeon]|nr:FKBP-type peptidyl-prolyl cis-trans isomerase [uncultured archaeon]
MVSYPKIFANPLYLMAATAVVIGLLAVIYLEAAAAFVPVVVAGDTVSVYYTGTFVNGTQFDSNVGKQPLQFTVGANQMIAGFDSGVLGMKLNESRSLTIPANEAYGDANPALIVPLPLSVFANQTVEKGMHVSSSANGQTFSGTVTAVNETTATVDFNSPLAGKTLMFDVKVVAIQASK